MPGASNAALGRSCFDRSQALRGSVSKSPEWDSIALPQKQQYGKIGVRDMIEGGRDSRPSLSRLRLSPSAST